MNNHLSGTKKLYNHFVSLGRSCEVSSRFYEHYGSIEHTLLTWARVYDYKNIFNLILNYNHIFSEGFEYIEKANMFKCTKYNAAFHGFSPDTEMKDASGNIKKELFDKNFEDLVHRIYHLGIKTKKIIDSGEKKLFILAFCTQNKDWSEDFILLENIYKRLLSLSTNFDLLLILEENNTEIVKELSVKNYNNLYIRTVKVFSEETLANINSDPKSWASICEEFCHKKHFEQKKKYKFE